MGIINIEKLTKKYEHITAVKNISLQVNKGEIFGLLGPNGAGKSTTLSMLATLLPPTAGTAFVNGFDIRTEKDKVRKSIGMVFQDPTLDDELTANENLDFLGRMYGVPGNIRKRKISELLKLVNLENRRKGLVKTFSGGMKRRLEIAGGMIHEPKILFLDEPTLGLDPQTRNKLWEYITKLNQEKKLTIILTTHYMEEADRLCHRIGIIDHGEIIALDTSEKLKDQIHGDVITLETTDKDKMDTLLKQCAWCTKTQKHENKITITVVHAENRLPEIVKMMEDHKIRLISITITKPSLEDVYLHFTGRTIREKEANSRDNFRMRRRISQGRRR